MVGSAWLRTTAVLAIAAVASALAAPARADDTACPPVWPPRAPASSRSLLDPDALLSLRTIGHSDPGIGGTSPLALSPDGRRLAFFVTQAVLSTNDQCETLVLLDIDGTLPPRVLDSGGSGIRIEEVLRGVRRPSGVFDVNVPVWQPDGESLVYRKRIGYRTQVWRAYADGRAARPLSQASRDVEAVGWSADGARILYAIRPGRAQASFARASEARTGYLYDARVLPHVGPEPQLPADLPEAIMAIDAGGGAPRRADEAEVAGFVRPSPLGAFALGPVAGPRGSMAGAAPAGRGYFAEQRLWVQDRAGRKTDCPQAACTGWLRGVWWQGREIMALKREGWARETSAIIAWDPAWGLVRTVLRTSDWLSGCVGAARAIICLAESARQPRRVVAFDPARGKRRVLFDPNPDIATGDLPPVERLRWRNDLGLEAWGDLVLPAGTPPPGGWPLVVVQYTSEGFLRGGTGDEYPIYPLAARGIAVLSFQRPELVASLRDDVTDVPSLVAALYKGWADRRSVHDSLMKGLDLVLERGDIDPARIGISGLSDGSTTARFALINDNRFAAAAISTCCIEPHSALTYGGIAQGDWFRSLGYPAASVSDPEFWRPMSLALNAERVRTPLLMQLADDEYLQALETFDALRDHGQPVEMLVFPGEHHNKWQPVHRAALYARNLDWFGFWLQGRIDPDPVKAAQYARWKLLKAERDTGQSGGTARSGFP